MEALLGYLPERAFVYLAIHKLWDMIYAFFNLGFGELFAIFVVVLLLFGADKIPQFARSLGKGIRYVKDATDSVKRDIESSVDEVKNDVGVNMDEVKKNMEVANSVRKKANQGVKSVYKDIVDSVDNVTDQVSGLDESSNPKKS